MSKQSMPLLRHRVVSEAEWVKARKSLLAREKELTRLNDALSAERRRLPWVKVEKSYVFDGPEGKASLADLFDGREQLIVYHFMFDPEWEEGCSGCTYLVDDIGPGVARHLHEKRTNLVLVSRAPLAKIESYRAAKGWSLPWYSSFGADFNYDFHVTLDDTIRPIEYNFKTLEELQNVPEGDPKAVEGEQPGISCFLRNGDAIYHTYSTYARGADHLVASVGYLDLTALGRQQNWEDSPPGWPQEPTYG